MPERPLVLFAQPTVAEKAKRHGGPTNFSRPSYTRQIERLNPKFSVLQKALNDGNIRITQSANTIDPEYTLVFQTIGDPNGFFTAINSIKEQYPNVEWIMELSGSCPNNDDFYMIDKNGRNDEKQLPTKVFCVLTNLQALNQILSLWNHFKSDENYSFERGFAGFKQLFSTLNDVHIWGIEERFDETGIIERWNDELADPFCTSVKTEIELFYRSSIEKRRVAESKVTEHVEKYGGTVICKSDIPEINYHAILADIPREAAEKILCKEETELITADEIMFLKSSGQSVSIGINDSNPESITPSMPEIIHNEPIVALFDSIPQENHSLLKDLMVVDDPDEIGAISTVETRIHGTSMASLILRGQDMYAINNEIHRLYVRPIMKSDKGFNDEANEFIPDDILIVDKIHECIRRLFEPSAGMVAPSIRIINLSIGLLYREYYNLISPLARLLDWLSFKYRVLFIVSAGNHTDDIHLPMDFASFSQKNDNEKNVIIAKIISDNIRNLRLLSPAESMNALSIGSSFSDSNNGTPMLRMTLPSSNEFPALYSSFGRGINNSIKPDIMYPGGRNYVAERISEQNTICWRKSITRAPGIQSAYPSSNVNDINVGYSCGTSNSAALISNKAAECYDILDRVFISERGEHIPSQYASVLIKAMLVHGASWSGYENVFIDALDIKGRSKKNELHKYLGYGITDVDKVKECTKNQVTLIGYGDIQQNNGYIYSIPLPFTFHSQKYKRKVTITLAYFTPIKSNLNKYREKQVWFVLDEGAKVAGNRSEYNDKAVIRGTLQHEIFESDKIETWDENDSLNIKVSCRGDATESNPDELIPYALFATFEMAPEYDIDVYTKVTEKIHIKSKIKSMDKS